MSILGYSAAYFLPQYWSQTPLYGEKIIPLLDYILSTDYQHTEKLASAFYDIENKYKNTGNLPIAKIEAIIEESGYGYIRNLLGQDEDSLRLLVYILVMIHELKGSKKGIETVLELLRTKDDSLEMHVVGNPSISFSRDVSDFSIKDYIMYSNFTVGNDSFDLSFPIHTSSSFTSDQCIASSPNCGFYLGIDEGGHVVLRVGKNVGGVRSWQTVNGQDTFSSERFLSPDTTYTINLSFTGYNYVVSVVRDGVSIKFLTVDSVEGLSITGGSMAAGLDVSTSTLSNPFAGTIRLAPLSLTANNIKITQWFESFPVDTEDTFVVDAELDINLMSEDFFVKFAKFVERYVYPTLKAFRVRMSLKAKVTFLPWIRQKVNYVASNVGSGGYENFNVLREDSPEDRETYGVQEPLLYAWAYEDKIVYTQYLSVYPATTLYNSDKTICSDSAFEIKKVIGEGIVSYKITYNGHETARSPHDDVHGPTPFQTKDDRD